MSIKFLVAAQIVELKPCIRIHSRTACSSPGTRPTISQGAVEMEVEAEEETEEDAEVVAAVEEEEDEEDVEVNIASPQR